MHMYPICKQTQMRIYLLVLHPQICTFVYNIAQLDKCYRTLWEIVQN